MKIAICDDDWHMQQTLRLFIDQTYQDLDMLVDGFTSGEALLAAVQKQIQPYQLILLDIEMRGIDGIETAKRLRKLLPDCYIIFITSHDEFALTGYEVAALSLPRETCTAGKIDRSHFRCAGGTVGPHYPARGGRAR